MKKWIFLFLLATAPAQAQTAGCLNGTLYAMVPAGFTYEVNQVSFAYTLNGWLETW